MKQMNKIEQKLTEIELIVEFSKNVVDVVNNYENEKEFLKKFIILKSVLDMKIQQLKTNSITDKFEKGSI